MYFLRLFLTILLCLAIPLQGVAGIVAVKIHCPLASGLMSPSNDDKPACCNDAETVVKSGKLCKAEKECQPLSQALINNVETGLPLDFAGEKRFPTEHALPACHPSGHWRPPTRS